MPFFKKNKSTNLPRNNMYFKKRTEILKFYLKNKLKSELVKELLKQKFKE